MESKESLKTSGCSSSVGSVLSGARFVMGVPRQIAGRFTCTCVRKEIKIRPRGFLGALRVFGELVRDLQEQPPLGRMTRHPIGEATMPHMNDVAGFIHVAAVYADETTGTGYEAVHVSLIHLVL